MMLNDVIPKQFINHTHNTISIAQDSGDLPSNDVVLLQNCVRTTYLCS